MKNLNNNPLEIEFNETNEEERKKLLETLIAFGIKNLDKIVDRKNDTIYNQKEEINQLREKVWEQQVLQCKMH